MNCDHKMESHSIQSSHHKYISYSDYISFTVKFASLPDQIPFIQLNKNSSDSSSGSMKSWTWHGPLVMYTVGVLGPYYLLAFKSLSKPPRPYSLTTSYIQALNLQTKPLSSSSTAIKISYIYFWVYSSCTQNQNFLHALMTLFSMRA